MSACFVRLRRAAASVVALCAALCAVASPAQQFRQPTVFPTGNWPAAVYTADINGDGIPDLIYIDAGATATAATTHVLLGNGHGGFTAGAQLTTAGTSLAIGDFAGTGAVALAWLSTDASGQVHLRAAFYTANGSFSESADITPAVPGSSAHPAQFAFVTTARLATGNPGILAEDTANGNLIAFQMQPPAAAGSPYSATAALVGPLPDGAGPMFVADLDRDGAPDVIVNGLVGKTAQVFLHSRFGQAPVRYSGTGGVASMLLVDIDGDGQPDLITAGPKGSIDIFHGNADGTFAATSLIGTGASFAFTGNGGQLIAAEDINGDGRIDLLTATPIGISVLLNDAASPIGHPNFKLKGIYNAGPGRSSYAIADFNGDGIPDLALDSPEGVAVLFARQDASFRTSLAFPTGQPAYDVVLGGFSAGGNLDAVIATGVPQIQLLSGDGQGNFAFLTASNPQSNPQTNPQRTLWPHLVQGDFDGDGKLDIGITLDGKYAPTTGDGLSVQFGDGHGGFSAPLQQASTAGSPHFGYSASGDFNGDGITDIANLDIAFYSAYLGGSAARNGTMPRSVVFNDTSDDNGYGGVANFLDLDSFNLAATGFLNPGRTTRQDIVFQDDTRILIYKNNGDATFTQVNSLASPSTYAAAPGNTGNLPNAGFFPGALIFTDLDGDGYGDVIVAFHNLAADIAHPTAALQNQIWIYWGLGDGNFTAPQVLTPSRNFYQLAVADVTGDGVPDLILSDGYLLSVQRNLGQRTFGAEQHYLAGMGINIVRAADVNHDGSTDLVIANGGVVLANPVANKGTLAVADPINTGGITVLLNSAISRAVTGNVAAAPEPSPYGTAFTLTATITAPASGATPTGAITFSMDGNNVGSAALGTNGVATLAINAPTYTKGAHTLGAQYSGDNNYDVANFTGTHTVTGLRSQTSFTITTPAIFYGQTADGNASVIALDTAAGADVNGGTITFYDGATQICVLVVMTTPGTCPASAGAGFSVGTHVLTAVYSGNQYYDGSQSPGGNVVVSPDTTAGTLASSLNPSSFGQAVTLTASFTAPYATPTGTVTFLDGSTPIGSAQLDATGTARLLLSTLAVGTHTLTASLAASLDFNASVSTPLQQIVSAATNSATATLLASSSNPSAAGQAVTFTATVVTTGGVILIPSGSVTFAIDGTPVNTATLNAAGLASYTTSTLAVGTHSVLATYAGLASGATTFAPSTSATLSQIVAAASSSGAGTFTLVVNPPNASVPIGSSVSGTVTITPVNGFSQPVALSCAGLPLEATCTFDTATIPVGGGTTRIVVAVAAPHTCGTNTPYFVASGPTTTLGALAAIGLLWLVRRRRRVLQGLALAIALALLPAIAGCGNCTDLGVRPGTYNFTVAGTAPGATVSQNIQMLAHL